MDLLTSLVTEFEIPIIRKDQKIWFFRTKAGKYYYDFRRNSFIALGWDMISPELITDSNQGKEAKKAQIEKLYPDEKRPGLILGQMDVFYNQMHAGDLVIIPSEGTKEIAVGKIGGLADEIKRKPDNSDYDRCSFTHKRNVEWLKRVESWQDIYLFKALRAQQTISDITEDAKLVFRNLFPVYIFENSIHLSVQKPTQAELSLASNVELLTSIIQISDATAKLYDKKSFSDEMHIKTAVGSPGFLEIIWPEIPVAAISVALVAKSIIGKQKGADGSVADGIMAIITKANELINDHHTRKKIDAETQKIMAEAHLVEAQAAKVNVEMEEIRANADKACAEAELMRAQAAKANAEARSLEQENEQIILLPSGMTTEEARIDNERLNIPVAESVNAAIAEITTKYPLDAAILCAALNKADIWQYEKEWRFVFTSCFDNCSKYLPVELHASPSSISLGYHFIKPFFYNDYRNNEEIEFARKQIILVMRLLEYASENKIPLCIMMPSIGEYKLYPASISAHELITFMHCYFSDWQPEDIRYYYTVHDKLLKMVEREHEYVRTNIIHNLQSLEPMQSSPG